MTNTLYLVLIFIVAVKIFHSFRKSESGKICYPAKMKQMEKTYTFLTGAGKQELLIVVPFKPREWIPAFIHDNKQGFPACHPVPTDNVDACVVSFSDGAVWAIKLKWDVSGERGISLTVRNYVA